MHPSWDFSSNPVTPALTLASSSAAPLSPLSSPTREGSRPGDLLRFPSSDEPTSISDIDSSSDSGVGGVPGLNSSTSESSTPTTPEVEIKQLPPFQREPSNSRSSAIPTVTLASPRSSASYRPMTAPSPSTPTAGSSFATPTSPSSSSSHSHSASSHSTNSYRRHHQKQIPSSYPPQSGKSTILDQHLPPLSRITSRDSTSSTAYGMNGGSGSGSVRRDVWRKLTQRRPSSSAGTNADAEGDDTVRASQVNKRRSIVGRLLDRSSNS